MQTNRYISHRVFLQPSFVMENFTKLDIMLRKEFVILLGFAPFSKRETCIIVDPKGLEECAVRSLIEKCVDSLEIASSYEPRHLKYSN